MVCAHIGGRGHRGKTSALPELRPYDVWASMEVDIGEFVQHCLHCLDSRAKELRLRPSGEPVHIEEVGEAILFKFPYRGWRAAGQWRGHGGDQVYFHDR